MQTNIESVIKGQNVSGETREYTFLLMDAETSTQLFHEWAPTVTGIYKELVAMIGRMRGEDLAEFVFSAQNIISVLEEVPKMIPWDIIKDWASKMLPNHKVEIDGTEYVAGENGFTDYLGDPLEVYVALVYAMMANYPQYVTPFLAALMAATEPEN